MVLFPRNKPVIENLNGYYVDIGKMLEHYQGQLTCGAVHFKASSVEGVVFFDENEPLTGMVDGKSGFLYGTEAVDHLLAAASEVNFTLGVYEVAPDTLYFWTHLPEAHPIYDNLSTEFADLNALAQKMKAEGLTGLIDVQGPDRSDSSIILFENGRVIDVASPLIDPALVDVDRQLEALVAATRNRGGSISVRQIRPAARPEPPASGSSTGKVGDDLTMLEELMDIFERAVSSQNKDFHSLFRRQCIANAERFDFLDPFVAEFEYAKNTISFSGDAKQEELARGLLTTLTELAEELGISNQVRHALQNWEKKWGAVLKRHGFSL